MNLPSLLTLPGLRQLGSLSTAHSSSGAMGPAVRLLLYHFNLNEKDVKPSGPKGNLLKHDVLQFIKVGNLKPVLPKDAKGISSAADSSQAIPKEVLQIKPGQKYIDIPLTNMRRAIARRLLASKQNIPHSYATARVSGDRLEELRLQFRKDGVKVSVNDFIVKAAATALRAVPEVNVQYKNGEIVRQNTVDISVAVSTPAGLITPIVFNADRLGVAKISEIVRELAKKAKDNKLQPAEFEGGTFTVSNLGMFGSVSDFTAIINPPQAAILAIGGTEKEYVEDGIAALRFSVSLCYDGRAITELDAQRFLEHFKCAIGEPDLIFTDTKAFVDLAALL